MKKWFACGRKRGTRMREVAGMITDNIRITRVSNVLSLVHICTYLHPSPPMTIVQFIQTQLHADIRTNADLPFTITEQIFPPGKIITAYGQQETNAYFLKSGLVQISMMYNGDEKILDFVFENNFFGGYTSLLTSRPSDTQLTTLAETEVEIIAYSDLLNAYAGSLLANQLGRHVTERLFVNYTIRQKDLLTKTAEQRYRDLLEKRPDIIALIPVNKIAKYLGIHPESLSRIRKAIIS